MFSSGKNGDPAPYPDVPDSLRSESFEMSTTPKTQGPRADTAPYLTPYLSLRSRLSQTWINRWTVLLLLVLVRVVILVAQLNDNVGEARDKALSSCTKVEDIGSTMASMPHYLSLGVNDLAASGVENAVGAMVSMLDLVLQGVEGLVIFYIDYLTATYTCLLSAMIQGSLDMVASVADNATDSFTSLVEKTTKEIGDIADKLQGDIDDLVAGIEDSVPGNFIPEVPTVNFSRPADELRGFELNATDFAADIRALDGEIPDFEEVQKAARDAISGPFDVIRKALNDSYGSFKFDKTKFPVAQKKELTFCSDNNTLNDFFRDLFRLIGKARVTFVVVLVLLALAAIVPMAWIEIKRWRLQQNHAKLMSTSQYDPKDVVYIASNPLTATWGIKLASRFKGKQQILVRWCVAYATSPAAMFVLSLALAGFFSCVCQYVLLRAVREQVPALSDKVGEFAGDVVSSLKDVSGDWADSANDVMAGVQSDINGDVSDAVKNATEAVNDTLATFVEAMNEGLESVFDGTVLLDPIKGVLKCAVGNKMDSVQKGLVWVQDNAKVSLPQFSKDTFSLGAEDSISGDSKLNTFLATPASITTDEVTGAVKKVTDWLRNSLVQEALFSTGLLLVYIIVVLVGVTRMLVGMATPDRGRGEGGLRYTVSEGPSLNPRAGHAEPHGTGQFPRFGSSSPEDDTPYRAQSEPGGEKTMGGVPGSRATQLPGYERTSSYGYLDTAGKFPFEDRKI